MLGKPLPGATYYLSSLHSDYTVQVVSFKTRLSQLLPIKYVVVFLNVLYKMSLVICFRITIFFPEVKRIRIGRAAE